MKHNEKFLKESIDLLSREFGQPLPTISSVMKNHQEQEVNKIKQEVNKIETVNEITLPAEIKRHMDKLVNVLQSGGLNRQKQLLVLALIVDALGIDASQLTMLMQKVKKTMGESVVLETPAAIAAAAASAVLHSPKGRDVKVSTALKDKEHPLHKRALNWVKSKMKKKDEPKKQSKSDSDFYRKQYEGKLK